MPSEIEWTDETWNPVTGCTKISTGCRNCYAERMAKRLAGRFGYPEKPNHFDVVMHKDKLNQPTRWKKPRVVFVCSMGDLFHKDVPDWWRKHILHRIYDPFVCGHHIYQILTKRPKRMYEVISQYIEESNNGEIPDNVWLGITAENQKTANERIPWLLKTPAAVRFVSVEPMLGPVDIYGYYIPFRGSSNEGLLDWVICGGETGPGAREMKEKWAIDLWQQCKDADVPFFFKKFGDAFDKDRSLPPLREAMMKTREWPNA